jgi:uncharacterized protein YecA (UPF0149 family)
VLSSTKAEPVLSKESLESVKHTTVSLGQKSRSFEGGLDKHTHNREEVDTQSVHMENVERNEPCPCGSGKRFKHCHGALG